ncbi:hypothetical protein FACS1894202_13140 [Clostridia bacterium]|nr:hypothetical protein FACS1894202_13140 [Clostridia bacterium]
MTQGISTIILLSVAVVVVAAVIAILFFGVGQSQDIANEGYGFFASLNNTPPITNWTSDSRPIAAISAFLRRNGTQITELRCNICGTVSSGENLGECLKTHLHGRGRLTLTETDGFYVGVLS